MALVDPRPEEAAAIRAALSCGRVDVVTSSFDQSPARQLHAFDMAVEYGKRAVETGHDFVLCVDTLNRLARCMNVEQNPPGKTLAGGLDSAALHRIKQFFATARDNDGHGSLTIFATAETETGSTFDDRIVEELQGYSNLRIELSGELAEQEVFPAIDVRRTRWRGEDPPGSESELQRHRALRRRLSELDPALAVRELMAEAARKS
jgi:transcription termination factor Rho